MHPDQETLKQMMEHAGFDKVEYHNLTAGVVAAARRTRLLIIAALAAILQYA